MSEPSSLSGGKSSGPASSRPAVVMIGHGSRRAESNARFEGFLDFYRERRPDLDVSHGYIELAAPALGDALREAARRSNTVVAAPLLLFRSNHAKTDLPRAVSEIRLEFPGVRFEISDVLGVHERLAELAYLRACETGLVPAGNPEQTAVVYIGRGSSDADANGDFFKAARFFAEGRGFGWMAPCFVSVVRPGLAETLEMLVRVRPERLVVVPHLLLPGVLIERITETVETFARANPGLPMAVAPPLGVHDNVLDALDDRVRGALDGSDPLPCNTCKYRMEFSAKQ